MIDIDEIILSQEQTKKLEESYKKFRLRNYYVTDYNKNLASETNLPVQLVNHWLRNKAAKNNPSNVKFNFNFKTMGWIMYK